jgi:nitric oxide synthase oxygenase domain/subunit
MKTPGEIEQLALEYESLNGGGYSGDVRKLYIDVYTQCQQDNSDKLNKAINLLSKLVENNELFFGCEVANKNSNICNAKKFIQSNGNVF